MRVPKPWFRSQSGTWYVQLNGKQYNLGSDKTAAFEAYHKLMLERGEGVINGTYTVRQVLAAYWDWLLKNRAPATCERRKPLLKSFGESLPATLKASELRALHVQKWVDAQDRIKSPTTARDYIALIKGVFNWAEAMGYIARNPIAKMPKPSARMRKDYLPVDAWPKILAAATDDEFHDYLIVMLSTGMRAEEIRKVEARHFDGKRFILPADETKGRKRTRVIYLPDGALATVTRPRWSTRKGRCSGTAKAMRGLTTPLAVGSNASNDL